MNRTKAKAASSMAKAIALEKELELDMPLITRDKKKLRKPSIYNIKIGEFMNELGNKNKYLPAQERMRRANKMYQEWKAVGAATETASSTAI